MRRSRFSVITATLFFAIPIHAQVASLPGMASHGQVQTPEQAAQATALIQQIATALVAGSTINDITSNGTVTFLEGANKGTGTVIYSATAAGQTKSVVTTLNGVQTSFRDYSVTPHMGTTTGPDGSSRKASPLDLLAPHPASYFPAFLVGSTQPSSGFAAADMGQEMRAGIAVRHVAIWPNTGHDVTVPTGALQQVGQRDLYVDAMTMLPVTLTFNLVGANANPKVKPFRRPPVFAPEELRFSDYHQVQGRPIAFHIQEYVHNRLVLEIQFLSVNINSGVVIAAN